MVEKASDLLKTSPQEIPPEARALLEAKGFTIYPLKGLSLRQQLEAGRPLNTKYWLNDKDFGSKSLSPLQVAVNPNQLFVPGTFDKNRYDQSAVMGKFSVRLGIPGVMVTFIDAAYIAELAFAHLDRTGERLFGEKFQNHQTRTTTAISGFSGSNEVVVGDFTNENLNIIPCDPMYRSFQLKGALLVVPSTAKLR